MKKHRISFVTAINNCLETKCNNGSYLPKGYKIEFDPDDQARYSGLLHGQTISGLAYSRITGAIRECWNHSSPYITGTLTCKYCGADFLEAESGGGCDKCR